MPKEIVSKDQITADPCLMIVKAFRISNKRAGEARNASNPAVYNEHVNKLRYLIAEAETRGFKIWVNENGKTGHTYAKDYKPTDDADNDATAHEALVAQRQAAMQAFVAQVQQAHPELAQTQGGEEAPETPELDDTAADNEPMGDVPNLEN